MEKQCFKCVQVKPIDEFYKHSRMSDGYLGKCKACAKADTIKNRNVTNRNYYLAYDKARAKTDRRKAWVKKQLVINRAKNPVANRARGTVANAVKTGKLTKELCHCGSTKVEGHHPDYNQPLFVIWLCNKHHKHAHNRTAL